MTDRTRRLEFRQRLLRLLFLFALIPAALLSVVGYILVTDAGSPLGPDQSDPGSAIADYYHNLIYRQLEIALETGATGSGLGADLVYTVFDGRIEMPSGTDVLTPSVANAIYQSAQQQPRGFAEINGRAYQYLFRDEGVGGKIAVFIHDAEYARLFGQLQSANAGRLTARDLRLRYSLFLGILFLVIAAATGAAAYLFSRKIAASLARPLNLLSDAATAVADGDFRARVEPQGDADIRQLIDSFNRMTDQLDQTTSRLAQTERVAAWRQVARRFAHELKNPLQPMLVSLYRIERLLIDTDAYEKIYEPLRATSEEVKHLKALAERFSHLAKLPPPTLESTDLNELIATVAALYEQQDAGYHISLDLPPGEVRVQVDAAYLREALHNLVQNGLDASDRRGEIVICLIKEDHVAEISVTDHGVGMDPQVLRSARLPYFTTKKEGHGLGLAIVEKSVSELGGSLKIQSAPGEGTRVSIILPVS